MFFLALCEETIEDLDYCERTLRESGYYDTVNTLEVLKLVVDYFIEHNESEEEEENEKN